MRAGASSPSILKEIFTAAIEAASPYRAVRKNLILSPSNKKLSIRSAGISLDLNRYGRVFVAGAGKAVCQMARAVEEVLGDRITSGLVITKYGHSVPLKKIKAIEAGHPIPNGRGVKAAQAIMDMAAEASRGDLFIFLLTGGASALLSAPADGISLKDMQRISGLLIKSGSSIDEINTVRKHLSRVKGGRLAWLAYPARVITLIVSDVVGGDLSVIGSGPTAPDPSTFDDAIRILKKYGLTSSVPKRAIELLRRGAQGRIPETPGPGSRAFKGCDNVIIADNLLSLIAARDRAASLGYRPLILSSAVTGDTREAARLITSVLKEIKASGNPLRPRACVLMGGETTLKVTGRGKGGRNQEFALTAAIELAGVRGISVLAAGTDGTDGPTDAAGAVIGPNTLKRAERLGIDPQGYLARNDSYNFFRSVGGLFITGPTGTNVMDIAIGLVE
ncbi:MAG TPA: glycerate kinase [Thermodesulfobacteriota bacterium]